MRVPRRGQDSVAGIEREEMSSQIDLLGTESIVRKTSSPSPRKFERTYVPLESIVARICGERGLGGEGTPTMQNFGANEKVCRQRKSPTRNLSRKLLTPHRPNSRGEGEF